MKPSTFVLIPLALLVSAIGTIASENWPQFRGSGVMGSAENSELPDRWSETENVAWKVSVPGMGWSSTVIWGNRIFLTTAVSEGEIEEVKQGLYFGGERPRPEDVHEWRVLCYDLGSGEELWNRLVHRGVPAQARHLKNSYASETPVTDGERVYAYIGNVGLFAFDMDGKELWKRQWKPVETRHGWGTAASPALHGDRLYIVNDNEDQSFLCAIDKTNGELIWTSDRDEGSNWSPPFVWENSQRTEIITTGTGKTRSYDLEGNVLWTLGGFSSITVPSPLAQGDLLYLCSGYVGDKRRPVFAIRPGAKGDISLADGDTESQSVAWVQPTAAPYMPTPLLYDGRLYVLLDRGLFNCYDAENGDVIYERERLGKSAGFNASPLAYNGKIFCFGERGEAVVLRAGDDFEELHRNELGELIMATPAIAGDSLIVRTVNHLYCLKKK
ncbi:MAG: PQQ-binding-like beta-propeller repeat protein [Verrucomicrobiales bacterium]